MANESKVVFNEEAVGSDETTQGMLRVLQMLQKDEEEHAKRKCEEEERDRLEMEERSTRKRKGLSWKGLGRNVRRRKKGNMNRQRWKRAKGSLLKATL